MSAKIIYDGKVLADIKNGQHITLHCTEDKMEHEVIVMAYGLSASQPAIDYYDSSDFLADAGGAS